MQKNGYWSAHNPQKKMIGESRFFWWTYSAVFLRIQNNYKRIIKRIIILPNTVFFKLFLFAAPYMTKKLVNC
jgi:hypothetical protein